MGLFNKDNKEEKRIRRTIEANDFYKGIKCSFQKETTPFNEITIFESNNLINYDSNLKSDEITGITHNLKSNNFDSIIQASSDGIIIKDATNDIADIKIPFTNIIEVKEGELPRELIITLIDNQRMKCSVSSINADSLNGQKYVRDYMLSIINNSIQEKQLNESINDTTSNDNQLQNKTINKNQEYLDNIGAPREWAKEEIKKVEDNLYPILGKKGIFNLINVLETIATEEWYEEALKYLEYTNYRVNYYNNKKKDYLIEAKLADNIYKSYVTDGISRLDKVNGRFMAAQNMKLDILIEQNTKIIQLLEKIAKK